MLNKFPLASIVLAGAVLLTACNGTVTDTDTSADVTTSADTGTISSAASAASASTSAAPEIMDTAEPVETTEVIDTIETIEEITTTAAEQTAEPDEQTTTASSAETSVSTEAPAETTTTTSITTTSAPVEEPPEPVEVPETEEAANPNEVHLSDASLKLLADYGADAEKRQQYYTRINGRAAIPIIHITTKDEAEILSITEYTDCLVDVFGCEEEHTISTAPAGIRVRGNSTAYYGDESQIRRNLVPYRIKFNEKTNMLGLNDGAEFKSWVLLKSNWNLIMDYTAFNLADAIFDDEYYYSDCEFVHLYVNEKFVGVYLLAEQNQVNKNRVDINKPAEGYKGTDIGYFVEIDNYADPNLKPCFNVNYLGATMTDIQGEFRQFVPADYSIDSDIYSDAQIQYISKYINNVFEIVYEATQNDKYLTLDQNLNLIDAGDKFNNAKDTINAVMDLNSVVNMYILCEICHDYDCGEGSFYMAVDFSPASQMKRLTFTAPWDFNWAYNDAAARYYYAGAFNMMSFVNQYGDRTNPWFVTLMTEEWFRDMVSEKWAECFTSGKIPQTLDEIAAYLEENEDDLNRTDQWGTGNAYNLLDWVRLRCRWLDREFTE